MKENKTELKPCPFCGGKAELVGTGNFCGNCAYSVSCTSCNCNTDWLANKKEVVEAWNKRAFDYETANHISSFLQDSGYDDASKAVDCVFDL